MFLPLPKEHLLCGPSSSPHNLDAMVFASTVYSQDLSILPISARFSLVTNDENFPNGKSRWAISVSRRTWPAWRPSWYRPVHDTLQEPLLLSTEVCATARSDRLRILQLISNPFEIHRRVS